MEPKSISVQYNLTEMPSTFDQVVNLSHALSGELLQSSGVEVEGQDIINALSKVLFNGDSSLLKEKFNEMNTAIEQQASRNNEIIEQSNKVQEAHARMTESSNVFESNFINNENFFTELFKLSLFENGKSSENNQLLELTQLFIENKEQALIKLQENAKINLSKDIDDSQIHSVSYLQRYLRKSGFLDEYSLETPLLTLQSLSSKLAQIAIHSFVKILKNNEINRILDQQIETMIMESSSLPFYEMMESIYPINKQEIDEHKEILNALMGDKK